MDMRVWTRKELSMINSKPIRSIVKYAAKYSMMSTLLAGCLGVCSLATAAVMIEETQLVSTTPTLAQVAPAAQTFVVATASTVRVTLTDLAFPQALTTANLIVSNGITVAARLTQPGSVDIAATPGTYTVRVLGTGTQGGTLGVSVTAGTATLLQFNAGISASGTSGPANQSYVSTSVTIDQPGSYQATLTDHAFPASLATSTTMLLLPAGSTAPAACFPAITSVCGSSFTVSAATTYDLFIAATPTAPATSGLYTVKIASTVNTPYNVTHRVGTLREFATVDLTAMQHTVALSDLQYPAALGQMKVVIEQGGVVIANATSNAPVNFTASTGPAVVYTTGQVGAAQVGTSPEAGAFRVRITQASNSVLDEIATVTAPAATTRAYTIPINVSASGAYTARLRDLAFPSAISVLQATFIHDGTSLGSLNGTGGMASLQAAIGRMTAVVFAKTATAGSTGMFGVTLTNASNVVTYETTQGVGDLFHTRSLAVTSAGSLDISLADLGFPATFGDLALAITKGTTLSGQIFGGGKITLAATPGTYALNFVARANSTANYGLYGIKVEDTPPPPAVTFTAASTGVAAQGSTTVSWTSTGATSCVGSGGLSSWAGTKATSDTNVSVGPFTSDSTLTLTCTGLGGSTSANVQIQIAAPQNNQGSSGGGAINVWLTLILLLIAGLHLWVRDSYTGANKYEVLR
jgi:hypothetical protein